MTTKTPTPLTGIGLELQRALQAQDAVRVAKFTSAARGAVFLALLILTVPALVVTILSKPAHVPAFRTVAEHGSVVSIVVDETVAADDAALLQIADSFVPRFHLPMVELHVWTDGRMVPYEIVNITAEQQAARRAIVEIDVNRDVRTVNRPAK
jgi:hypothetical protein